MSCISKEYGRNEVLLLQQGHFKGALATSVTGWGMLKGKIDLNKLHTVEDLKKNIQREIDATSPDMLVDAFRNMERCDEMCLA